MKLFQVSGNAIPITEVELLYHNSEDEEVVDFLKYAKVGDILYGEGFNCLAVQRIQDCTIH